MIRTATAVMSDSSKVCPVSNHPASVAMATTMTIGTKIADTRSARCSIGALRVCASSTSRAI
jgi:hypothetical protein